MIRRAVIAVAFAAAFLGVNAGTAQAIPTGDTLFVTAYYADAAKTILVGQKWTGCGQPAGSWGVTTNIRTLFFTPC